MADEKYVLLASKDARVLVFGTRTAKVFTSAATAEIALKRMEKRRPSLDWLVLPLHSLAEAE